MIALLLDSIPLRCEPLLVTPWNHVWFKGALHSLKRELRERFWRFNGQYKMSRLNYVFLHKKACSYHFNAANVFKTNWETWLSPINQNVFEAFYVEKLILFLEKKCDVWCMCEIKRKSRNIIECGKLGVRKISLGISTNFAQASHIFSDFMWNCVTHQKSELKRKNNVHVLESDKNPLKIASN